jgi:hypothetical protein
MPGREVGARVPSREMGAVGRFCKTPFLTAVDTTALIGNRARFSVLVCRKRVVAASFFFGSFFFHGAAVNLWKKFKAANSSEGVKL